MLANIQWGIDQAIDQGNLSALKGFLELQGKAIAMYSDKVINDTSEEARARDDRLKDEAKALAELRLQQKTGCTIPFKPRQETA